MAAPTLPSPPGTTPLLTGGVVSQAWLRWFQQLQNATAASQAASAGGSVPTVLATFLRRDTSFTVANQYLQADGSLAAFGPVLDVSKYSRTEVHAYIGNGGGGGGSIKFTVKVYDTADAAAADSGLIAVCAGNLQGGVNKGELWVFSADMINLDQAGTTDVNDIHYRTERPRFLRVLIDTAGAPCAMVAGNIIRLQVIGFP